MTAPGANDLFAAVVARRERRAPDDPIERLGRAALDGGEWSQSIADYVRSVEQRSGWANHVAAYTTPALTLSLAAVKRAYEETGADAEPRALMFRTVEAIFDGYELACVLTGTGGDGKGRALKTGASMTTLATRAAKLGAAMKDGPVAEVLARLTPDWLKVVPPALHTVAAVALRNAFGAGLALHRFETEAAHPLLDGLHAATTKRRSAPEPAAKQAPPNPALLDAILAAPDDDEPRLVYADWLTEQGDPRGEFIQIQCTLGRTLFAAGARSATRVAPSSLSGLSADELKERETRLIKRHEKQWKLEAPSLRQWFWRRGFVFAGVADARAFAEALPGLARTPLERVRLTGYRIADVDVIRAAPAHPTLWAVDFSSNRLSAKSAAVLGAPLFSTVRWLDLSGNDLSREDAAQAVARAASESMPRLVRLNLSYTGLTDAGLRAVAATPLFARLGHLGLHACAELTPAGLAVLARATALESIELSDGYRGTGERFEALLAHAPPSLHTLCASIESLPPRLQLALRKRFTIDQSLRSSVLYT